jgi:hypothetical protein
VFLAIFIKFEEEKTREGNRSERNQRKEDDTPKGAGAGRGVRGIERERSA